jgi:hypothetical protein
MIRNPALKKKRCLPRSIRVLPPPLKAKLLLAL